MLGIILINVNVLIYTFDTNNQDFFTNKSIFRLWREREVHPEDFGLYSPANATKDIPAQVENMRNVGPMFSIQQENTTILLNETGVKAPESFTFIENIWANDLGSDPLVLTNATLFESGLIVTNDTDEVNNSLFVRIGNNGYGPADESLNNEYRLQGISAGWQVDFPVPVDFDVIKISFNYRFDALDGAFDDYIESLPSYLQDSSPDYQEIRVRIRHPTDDNKSFWLGNPVSDSNPNGTIFYRIGPEVTQDEEWFTFNSNFHVSPDIINPFTLEVGAYLNTREYWNEYFDVWFDDILIYGLNNVTDIEAPTPSEYSLVRTPDVSIYNFWANFSEGIWQSQIKNVTVYFNQTTNQSTTEYNASLVIQPPSFVTNAGYNQTHWLFVTNFNFSDEISYYFKVFDEAGNVGFTEVLNVIIGDFFPPEIISSLNVLNPDFISQDGRGMITITIDTYDWGNATDNVTLEYYFNDTKKPSLVMTPKGTIYQINLTVDYEVKLRFNLHLTDAIGNSRTYSNFEIVSNYDTTPPSIGNISVSASTSEEGYTFISAPVTDSFGKIDKVFLLIESLNQVGGQYSANLTLWNENNSNVYRLASENGLKLNFSENYLLTVYARDKANPFNSIFRNTSYTVPDIIAPRVSTPTLSYPFPGKLDIQVRVSDLGSGISHVILEIKTENGWDKIINLTKSREGLYFTQINTNWLGNELLEFRVNAIDEVGNEIAENSRPRQRYTTRIFVATNIGLLITEIGVILIVVVLFTFVKVGQRRRLRIVRRERFEIALGRSERLAYLGEEAMFGFVVTFGQREGVSSILMWEPRMIGNFYQYLKELADKANNYFSFVMQAKPQDMVSFIDFKIEEIGCSAVTFAYPVSTLPQRWLSSLTLDQVPMGAGQGVLLLMLLMREQWAETANDFQEEITDGITDIKDIILAGEDKETILNKVREFRLFISGTVEVLDEIEIDVDEVTGEIMGDFESEFLDDSTDDLPKDDSQKKDEVNDY